jgi:methionyl-tRNA formyltransferase
MTDRYTGNPTRVAVLGCGDHAAWAVERIYSDLGFCALLTETSIDKNWSSETPGAAETADRLACPAMHVSSALAGLDFLKKQKIGLVILCGTRWILPEEFIKAFNGRIINLHPSKLPIHRGAGVFTWQILNRTDEAWLTAYWVRQGIDDGPILFQLQNKEATSLRRPVDFLTSHSKLFKSGIAEILRLVNHGDLEDAVAAIDQDINSSSYFPLLTSDINGAIDWNWGLADIEVFIRAFSHPYPGAFSFYRDKKFHILEAEMVSNEIFHPSCFGLVLRHMKDGEACIICKGGLLAIQRLTIDQTDTRPSALLPLGARIWTPAAVLDRARTYRPTNFD